MATYQAVNYVLNMCISIHATHTGGDQIMLTFRSGRRNFNPRHPYGWRPYPHFSQCCIVLFQSTPPIRVATYFVLAPPNPNRFQSTPPIRVATWTYQQGNAHQLDFNPRHPYGWRQRAWICRMMQALFQSTPPIRVATVRRHKAKQG